MVNEVLRTDIPNDWDVITLGDYAQIFRGGSPRPIQAFLTTSDQGINWIKIGDVGAGEKFIESTEEKIIPEGVSRSRMVYKGDLILSNSMSYGRPYIMNIEGCIHDGWLVIQKYDRLFNREYLYYALSSDLTMQQYVAMAAGSSVQNLNKEKVSKVVLPCPKILEQKKIAEVLSSIDALIVDLQKLIRKKKDIRQGAMQMLVTGKKRLPGYYADFEHFTIGELGSLAKMSINPCQEPKTIFDEYSMPAFDDGAKPQQMLGELMLSSRIKLTPNTLLFNKLNVRQRRVWLVKDCSNNSVCSSEFLPYKSEKIDLSFLKQLLLTDKVTKDFEDISSGTSNSQQRITPSDFLKYEISIPSLEEQREIALILFDMDTEIQRLEEKLSKYQKVKQGMMEELLTGKVRLM